MKSATTLHDNEEVTSTPDVPTADSNRDSTHKTPRWVKVFGIIALAFVLILFVIGMFTGGHGPGRHTPQSSGTEQRVPQP